MKFKFSINTLPTNTSPSPPPFLSPPPVLPEGTITEHSPVREDSNDTLPLKPISAQRGIKKLRHRSNPKALMSNTPLLFVCFDQEIEVKLPLTNSSSFSSFSSSSDYIFPIFLNPFLFIAAHNKSNSLSSFTLTFPNCPLPLPRFKESLHIVKTSP